MAYFQTRDRGLYINHLTYKHVAKPRVGLVRSRPTTARLPTYKVPLYILHDCADVLEAPQRGQDTSWSVCCGPPPPPTHTRKILGHLNIYAYTLETTQYVCTQSKADRGGGAQGARALPLASLSIYSFLNNFVIFTTLVHLREAMSYCVGLPLKVSFMSRSIPLYFIQSLVMQTIMNCFPVPPPPLVKSWIRQSQYTLYIHQWRISYSLCWGDLSWGLYY